MHITHLFKLLLQNDFAIHRRITFIIIYFPCLTFQKITSTIDKQKYSIILPRVIKNKMLVLLLTVMSACARYFKLRIQTCKDGVNIS